MVKAIPDILARIVARKRAELDQARPHRAELEKLAQSRRDFRDFRAALRANPPAVIAEIKQASPSKGFLTATFDPASIAREYAAGGAAAHIEITERDIIHDKLQEKQ